jgi:hypothetical protein
MQGYRFLALSLVLSVACAATPAADAPVRSLVFVDSQQFDDQLRAALSQEVPDVTVSFHGESVTVNRVPERLDRWLYAISSRSGGSVQLQPDPERAASRAIGIMAALSLASGAYRWVREEIAYRPARHWNAIAYYEPGGEALTRVVFVPAQGGN